MTKGCEHANKKFTVPLSKGVSSGKKCFKGDCTNEGDTCNLCSLLQGKYTLYKPMEDK